MSSGLSSILDESNHVDIALVAHTWLSICHKSKIQALNLPTFKGSFVSQYPFGQVPY